MLTLFEAVKVRCLRFFCNFSLMNQIFKLFIYWLLSKWTTRFGSSLFGKNHHWTQQWAKPTRLAHFNQKHTLRAYQKEEEWDGEGERRRGRERRKKKKKKKRRKSLARMKWGIEEMISSRGEQTGTCCHPSPELLLCFQSCPIDTIAQSYLLLLTTCSAMLNADKTAPTTNTSDYISIPL